MKTQISEYLQKDIDNEALRSQELKKFASKDRFAIRNQINSTQQRAEAAIAIGHGFKNQTYKVYILNKSVVLKPKEKIVITTIKKASIC